MAFFAFLFSPFILSSNLIVVIGLMKADRVIYLPLFGFCLMEALVFKNLFCTATPIKDKTENKHIPDRKEGVHWLGRMLIMTQLVLFAYKTHERNLAWSSPVRLWSAAYEMNPVSYHTMYNCGYELSTKKRFVEAEQVMRPIGSARVNGPSNTFVYAMVLYNLNRIEDARAFVDEGLAVLEERKKEGGPRNSASLLSKTESNLLVALSFCQSRHNLIEAGESAWKAVQVDPNSQYAINQAQQISNKIEMLKKYQGTVN